MKQKLTDNEIIKALECCVESSHLGECLENNCPCVSENGCKVGEETLYPYLLDLINRQKAEIDRLNAVNVLTMSERNAFKNSFYALMQSIKKKIKLLDYLIDYLCECNGIRETIKILIDAGCTNQELQEMSFEKEDIDIIREENLNDIRR